MYGGKVSLAHGCLQQNLTNVTLTLKLICIQIYGKRASRRILANYTSYVGLMPNNYGH